MADILSPIRTLPLPEDAKPLFSRAVRLVQARPDGFKSVSAWLDKHYSESTLRGICERKYQETWTYTLKSKRLNGTGNFTGELTRSAHNREQAILAGRSREELVQETIREARSRGV